MNNLIEKLKSIEITTSKKTFSLLEIMYQKIHGKEVVQSEMLAGLLNPNENHGLEFELINSFLRQIKVNFKLVADSNLKVETERNANGRRIDIFISWWDDNEKTHAVIIENKLNNAPNQPNQLNDYHDAIIEEGSMVEKIVYMPFDKKLGSSTGTDTRKDVLAKTVDFDAQDIVNWLERFVESNKSIGDDYSYSINQVRYYKDFFQCLMSNQFIMEQAVKIQEQLSFEEIINLEKIAEITRTTEWCEVRFRSIVKEIEKCTFEKELMVKYKQDADYINYAQFYFDNWRNLFWYEIWLYPTDGIYIYTNVTNNEYTEIKHFENIKIADVAKFIIPLLQELSQK